MTPSLTHESRSREQVAAATEIVRDVLGDAAVAAYLFGSAVAGGLRPDSDLDILVVSARSLTGARGFRSSSGSYRFPGATPSAAQAARSSSPSSRARPSPRGRHPATIELQYGDWMRAELERGDAPAWPRTDPDAVILIETARRASVPLLGPPAAAILETAPHADLCRAMMDLIPILMPGIEEGDDRRNGLLTLARMRTTLATGEIRPKDNVADWALTQLPEEHRPVLAHARAAYLGEESENWSDLEPRVRPHVDHVVSQIRTFAGSSG